MIVVILYLAVVVVVIAGGWKMFEKAGKPGWAFIVPIYSAIVLLEIVGKPIWWIVLLLIPVANIIVLIIVMNELAKSFGKGTGFTVGLVLLAAVFIPILGFGDAKYQGAKG
jgi:hypothetical protein